ncbi:hypothetical protein RJ640_011126 [Escallonia rubra]|uniref:Large ribosomal subunit protein uL6 alpha-beta domain-containing protein n=1 Tax=Escallonia rubra TaxID=112253 RepID=A0AA88RLX9_9ASTE|nr:hypothetical protein RJ640_011126 [Escallonia rubra]
MEAKFFRFLKIVGVGFKARAESEGRLLYLKLGYSHEVELTVPPAVRVFCFKNNVVCCTGIEKQRVHQFAAAVRSCKPPEVYKGKGIMPQFLGENNHYWNLVGACRMLRLSLWVLQGDSFAALRMHGSTMLIGFLATVWSIWPGLYMTCFICLGMFSKELHKKIAGEGGWGTCDENANKHRVAIIRPI